MLLPAARGPLTEVLFRSLRLAPHDFISPESIDDDPLLGDDFQLALYCCYELHYRGFEEIDQRWEWHPSLLAFRATLEERFESALGAAVGDLSLRSTSIAADLIALAESDEAPSLARFMETRGTEAQFLEFLIHRSAYQLKEADPHSWAIPRLEGRPKAALVEIQGDEYGSGDAERMHAVLFARSMKAMGLDDRYGAYLEILPGVTLATVNVMSFFGLHRRWRGALVGHLALFEMTSTDPNRRYGNGLRRLGHGSDVTFFFDEHVEADSVHEQIAAHDLAGALASQSPSLAPDILFGAAALLLLEDRWARHLLDSWGAERSSLLRERVVSERA